MSSISSGLDVPLRRTPLHYAQCAYQGRVRRIGLKAEKYGPTGSVKDRTAVGLLRALHQERPLEPGTVVIESTSGNLGIAMARLLHSADCGFLAVVDLKTPPLSRRMLKDNGARVIVVDEPDGRGGYLLSRLHVVHQLCTEHPDYRWPNQYENPASPAIHRDTTGPELTEQAGKELTVVYVPVSTGGTFAGIAAHLRRHRPDVMAVAVDVTGSLAVGGRAGRRLIPGIGSSQPSLFLRPPNSPDRTMHVDDVDAIAVCRIVAEDLGRELGGTSGCTLRALLADMEEGRSEGLPVCMAADGGRNYQDTLYSDDWAASRHIGSDLRRAVERLRRDGLRFSARTYEEQHGPPTPTARPVRGYRTAPTRGQCHG